MEEFESFDDLKKEIERDSERYERFPVRFILVDDLENWKKVANFLGYHSSKIFYLSEYCKGKDTLPNFAKVREVIEEELKRNAKITLIPFSEYLRFFPEERKLLRDLAVLEKLDGWNKGTMARLYIPLFSMESILDKEMKQVSRFQSAKSGECAEIYFLKNSGMKQRKNNLLFNIVKECVNFKRLAQNRINGIRDYFELWEQNISEGEYVVITGLAERLEETEGILTIRTFNNNFKVLTTVLEDVNNLKAVWGDEEKWSYLLNILPPSAKSLLEVFEKMPRISFDPQSVFLGWQEYKPEEKWLVWLSLKIKRPIGYLKLVLEGHDSFNSFIDRLTNAIFDLEPERITPELTLERKKILEKVLKEDSFPQKFWTRLESVPNDLKIRYLTGLTDEEKANLIRHATNYSEDDCWLEYLSIIYPELRYYLANFDYNEKDVNEYFYYYKRAKLIDEITHDIESLADKIAESQIFRKFPSRNSVLEEQKGYIYWFDALGVEWLSFIEGILRDKHNDIEYLIKITRCNIPTITDNNKGWTEFADYRDYDELIHNNVTSYPDYIIKEFKCVREGIMKAVCKLNSHPIVIITSDHGSSRLSAISKNFISSKGIVTEKYGRYAKNIGDFSPDYKEFIEEDEYIVSATHRRFEGCGYKAVEIHGGATLEEVLVPVIIIQRKGTKNLDQEVEIVDFSESVKFNQEGVGVLTVSLNRSLDNLKLIVEKSMFDGTYKDGIWEFRLKDFKSGKYKGELIGEKKKIGEIRFEVIRGIIEKDLGL